MPDLIDWLTLCQPVRHLYDGPVGISENKHIRLGVGQNGVTHLIGPVVVMGNAPETGLDTANDDWDSFIGLPHPL